MTTNRQRILRRITTKIIQRVYCEDWFDSSMEPPELTTRNSVVGMLLLVDTVVVRTVLAVVKFDPRPDATLALPTPTA